MAMNVHFYVKIYNNTGEVHTCMLYGNHDYITLHTIASFNFYAAMHPCTINSFSGREFLIHAAVPKIRAYHCTKFNVH